MVGKAGIVLNPNKFLFAWRDVKFTSFHISDNTIDPLPKYFNAMHDFPMLPSTMDFRSWFGLVNQITNYTQLQDHMKPFWPFLSPCCMFLWDEKLDDTFKQLNLAIINTIRHGVKIFDLKWQTCLRPNFSKEDIRYFLLQKYCNCISEVPDCCEDV